ncbi:hypothetical protein GBAR_LOCUS28267 [Geodia barretti]|uniref:Mycothiol-dependent maleylpyruvate isomerase metal-binding domain-containing protein n=1 Tax=Geodia barretti TaxID=519541 RepID=A0AA35TNQ0_GEOBA|nr:hypothetical protein GBAR_LOCUS28267 [Geodia barretti]
MTSYDEEVIRQEVAVIGALARGLNQFLNDLSPNDLRRHSACDAWTVRDVAGHLTNRAERQITSMTRGREGDSGPPPGFSAPSDMMAMSAANADADIAYSISMGDDLLPTFERRYRELHLLLNSFGGDDWRCACWHPRRGTMTAREYVSQRIQELAVHDWDIRSAFRSAGSPASGRDPRVVGDVRALAPVGAGLHPNLDDIDMVVACNANTYLLLAYGRVDVDTAANSLVAIGEEGLLERFASWMVGF